jgi:hypothetical protein
MDKRIIFLIISLLAASITFATLYFLKKDGTPPNCPPGSLIAIKTCDNNPSFAGKLVRSWKGTDMIPSNGKGWSYFTGPDITHGEVTYRQGNPDLTDPSGNFYGSTKDQLVIKLSYVQAQSVVHIDSIRIRSAELFNYGLFVIDLEQIPYGQYIWPAFWLNGLIKGGSNDAWAISGEIDIIEGGWQPGGGKNQLNTVSLHTSPGYKQTNMNNLGSGDCATCGEGANCKGLTCGKNGNTGEGNKCPFIGCGAYWPTTNGYGEAFKNNGGGIYACNLNCDGTMKFWFIPSDNGVNMNYTKVKNIMSSNASLSTSILDGLGVETLDLNDKNTGKTFDNLQIIINTTVCGDAYSGKDRDTCDKTEVDNLIKTDPDYVKNASWKINTINVYQ